MPRAVPAGDRSRDGIRGVAARRFRPVTTDSRHGLPMAPDRLGLDLQPPAPNQVWLSAVAYMPTGEGWLDLTPRQPLAVALRDGSSALPMMVLDLATPKVVGWAMRDQLRAELAATALPMGPSGSVRARARSPIPIAAAICRQRLPRAARGLGHAAVHGPQRLL